MTTNEGDLTQLYGYAMDFYPLSTENVLYQSGFIESGYCIGDGNERRGADSGTAAAARLNYDSNASDYVPL